MSGTKIGIFEKLEIKKHFSLEKNIAELENKIEELRQDFYNQTLCSHIAIVDQEMTVLGFNIEKNVAFLIDTIHSIERRIERQTTRKNFFDKYMESLHPIEREYLKERYSKDYLPKDVCQLDEDLYAEILEINDAINYMNGYPVEIESVEVNNDNLEDEFSQILEALEV